MTPVFLFMWITFPPVRHIFLFFIFPCITSSGIMSLSAHGFYIPVCRYKKHIFPCQSFAKTPKQVGRYLFYVPFCFPEPGNPPSHKAVTGYPLSASAGNGISLRYNPHCSRAGKERTVPLGSLAKGYMKEYLSLCPFPSEMVFVSRRGCPLTCNAVKLLVSRLSSELPFEFSSHRLRHNFATNYCIDQYEERGQVDIYRLMILLGHEDIETTKRYLHHANEIIGARGCISHLDKIYGEKN